MTDYARLIDEETWAFIRETGTYYPPDAVTLSVEEQRAVYDRMCRAFHQGYPEGVRVEDISAEGVPCRLYETGTPDVTVVYFHGGGFVVGGLESHDDVCAEICDRTGYRVVSVDYRLAPEHAHPAPFDDARTAALWTASRWPGPLVLAGDSAGGNLAAAVSHAARSEGPKIVGQVLIYPALGGDHTKGSYVIHPQAPMLTVDDMKFYQTIRTKGAPPPTDDPTYMPLHDTDFSHLPPTVCITAECDPLSSDGGAYRDVIRAAGGRAEWIEDAGLVHGHLRARATVTRAARSFDRIVDAIDALGRGDWPYA